MNFFCVLTVLAAGITMANAKCDASTNPPCKYDCPLIGKDFYGSDIACGYNLAADWKACGKDGMLTQSITGTVALYFDETVMSN